MQSQDQWLKIAQHGFSPVCVMGPVAGGEYLDIMWAKHYLDWTEDGALDRKKTTLFLRSSSNGL